MRSEGKTTRKFIKTTTPTSLRSTRQDLMKTARYFNTLASPNPTRWIHLIGGASYKRVDQNTSKLSNWSERKKHGTVTVKKSRRIPDVLVSCGILDGL